MVPYKIIKADNGDAWVEASGKKMSPPQISAQVLKKMKKTAEDYLGEEVIEAVITVPAYFNDSQRQATKDAGQNRRSGCEAHHQRADRSGTGLWHGPDMEGDRTIAVYDLGGGTFDISIIEIAEVMASISFEVLSTNGDTFLGGEDFDLRLIDYLAERIQERQQHRPEQATRWRCSVSKKPLRKRRSSCLPAQQTEVNLPYITADDSSGPKHLVQKLTRAKFESLVEDLVESFVGPGARPRCRTPI